jgi:ubiquinone/menaquinone biosynthesis C-methylase UbiE
MTEERRKVVGDALALPFRDSTFDLINCCLFVHHLSPEQVTVFIKEALRCSRVAVLINDLIRHPVHFAMACAGRLIYRSRITRNDAPASVRQSYTPEEMRNMLQESGAARIEITRHYFYRMGAIVWKMADRDHGSHL